MCLKFLHQVENVIKWYRQLWGKDVSVHLIHIYFLGFFFYSRKVDFWKKNPRLKLCWSSHGDKNCHRDIFFPFALCFFSSMCKIPSHWPRARTDHVLTPTTVEWIPLDRHWPLLRSKKQKSSSSFERRRNQEEERKQIMPTFSTRTPKKSYEGTEKVLGGAREKSKARRLTEKCADHRPSLEEMGEVFWFFNFFFSIFLLLFNPCLFPVKYAITASFFQTRSVIFFSSFVQQTWQSAEKMGAKNTRVHCPRGVFLCEPFPEWVASTEEGVPAVEVEGEGEQLGADDEVATT